jgi:uncharacterized radical SAM protein YgiQ
VIRENKWLPINLKEVKERDWEELDVILFTGDAYIDHPSFGPAVIARVIESQGLKIAVVPQPNWRDDLRDFKKLGKPNLFFAVSAGNMDSMVNHYTANKRLRSDDAYSPNGKSGFRPDRACSVYSKILKSLYPDVPVVIGGIEASLRRLTHYDYWDNKLMPSIIVDSKADILIYGMGEKPIVDIIKLAKKGVRIDSLTNIPQTVSLVNADSKYATNKKWDTIELNSHEKCLEDKKLFAQNFKHIEIESNSMNAAKLTQRYQDKLIVVNPPNPIMTDKQLDAVYDLPFTRLPHPKYKSKHIPAFEMIKFSVNLHRGCFGGCSFCTISAHQGKWISSRSEKSIMKEIDQISEMPDFKGYLSDLGGPSANMYKMSGNDKEICKNCKRPSCIFPSVCKNLNSNHDNLTQLYKKVDKHKKIKKAFIGSGVRYDMLISKSEISKDSMRYFEQLITRHVSGRLKVAPEHTEDTVLNMMRKPSFDLFFRLKDIFDKVNKKHNLKQQLIPYFISSHPSCKTEHMASLAARTKNLDFKLEQVQDFTPTPMTLATVIYYSGYDPYDLKPIYTPKTKDDKLKQRMFFFWYKKQYQKSIKDELKRLKQFDLINKLFDK